MFYEWAVDVPANTAEADAVNQRMVLTTGLITRVEVQFPNGCAGLAHCRILHHGAQHWPTPPSSSMASDGYAIVIDEEFDLDAEPYELIAYCWNDDDTFQHTVYVRVNVLRGVYAKWFLALLKGLEKLLKLVGIGV